MADHWRDHKVRDVFERLDVVRLRVKLRLSHLIEPIEVNCLRFTEGCTGQPLIGRDAHHVVPVQDQVTHGHINFELILHLSQLIFFLLDHLEVLFCTCLHRHLVDFFCLEVDQVLACVPVVVVLGECNCVQLATPTVLEKHVDFGAILEFLEVFLQKSTKVFVALNPRDFH